MNSFNPGNNCRVELSCLESDNTIQRSIPKLSHPDILPTTNLWNLQSLIVDTPSRTLEVKGDIWKMRHLRHFKTHTSIILKKNGVNKGGEKLQTLSKLSPESFTVEVCEKATNLLTLGIQGDLRTLGNSNGLGCFKSLNKLTLAHQVSPGEVADNPFTHLPDSHSFPPNLKILVLSGTRLDWSKMSTFSAIVSLEMLKLKKDAFQGDTWRDDRSGFVNLVSLYIERADLENWTASDVYLPVLKFLRINNCEKLKEIPHCLGKKLEELSLVHVAAGAVKDAKDIKFEQWMQERVVRLTISI